MDQKSGLLLSSVAIALLVVVSACTTPIAGTDMGNGFRQYRDAPEGIRFEYPASWLMEKSNAPEHQGAASITLTRPDKDLVVLFQTGGRENFANSPGTLEEWRDQFLASLPNVTHRSDYKLVASEPATLSGNPAWRIEYTGLVNNGPRMRGELYLMMNGTRGTMVALFGNDDSEGVLSDGPQHFVRSIEITG